VFRSRDDLAALLHHESEVDCLYRRPRFAAARLPHCSGQLLPPALVILGRKKDLIGSAARTQVRRASDFFHRLHHANAPAELQFDNSK
jgi:hypothetical protein